MEPKAKRKTLTNGDRPLNNQRTSMEPLDEWPGMEHMQSIT